MPEPIVSHVLSAVGGGTVALFIKAFYAYLTAKITKQADTDALLIGDMRSMRETMQGRITELEGNLNVMYGKFQVYYDQAREDRERMIALEVESKICLERERAWEAKDLAWAHRVSTLEAKIEALTFRSGVMQ